MDEAHDIAHLKDRLLGISSMIWRRVQVPIDMTLRELHGVFRWLWGGRASTFTLLTFALYTTGLSNS